jgi:hypothetical protein
MGAAMKWIPATLDEVTEILKSDLAKCDPEMIPIFEQYAVEPHFAPIERYGKIENVVVVAQKSGDVIYWEDVECGFNVSPIGPDGRILEHWCNQDPLTVALYRLDQLPENRDFNWGPAKPLDPM